MPDSIRSQILQAVATRLDAIAGFTFLRNPTRDLAESELPAIQQFDGGQATLDVFTGNSYYQLRVDIEVYETANDEGDAVEEGLAKVADALIDSNGENTLGGLAEDVEVSDIDDPISETDQGRLRYRVAAIGFLIKYRTAETDFRSLGPA